MKWTSTLIVTALVLGTISAADARPRHRGVNEEGTIVAHPAGCPPVAFCGCGVSVKAFGHSIRSLWPANAWRQFPQSVAGTGKVAIWGRHHVAYILSVDGDVAELYDPNSGRHQTRIHRRSLAGATIVDPHGVAHGGANRWVATITPVGGGPGSPDYRVN